MFWLLELLLGGLLGSLLGLCLELQFPPAKDDAKMFKLSVQVVAALHAVVSATVACFVIQSPELQEDPVLATTFSSEALISFSFVYFCFDLYITWRWLPLYGYGFLLHAILCSFAYGCAHLPYMHYYGAAFLLLEMSTPFVHLNQILPRTSLVYLVNGVVLLLVFFAVRIVYTPWLSWQFLQTLFAQNDLSVVIAVMLMVCLLCLNGLNFYWYTLMLRKARQRVVNKNKDG